MQLRPVTYNFDIQKQDDFIKGKISAGQLKNYTRPASYNEASFIRRTGFIAQEVEAAAKKTGFDFDGIKAPQTEKQYYSLSYASFVVPLVKAVQEQQKQIKDQQTQIEKLTKENEELRSLKEKIEALQKAVQNLSANK